MKKYYRKGDKTRLYLIVTLIVLLITSVGYAVFTEQLDVSGTVSGSATFRVYFTEATVTESTKGTASINANADTVTFTTNLTYPGDRVQIATKIKNESSIPVKLNDFLVKKVVTDAETGEVTKVNLDSTADIKMDYEAIDTSTEILQPNGICDYRFVIYWDSYANQTTTNPDSQTFEISLNYQQYTTAPGASTSHENAVPVVVTFYENKGDTTSIGTVTVNSGSAIGENMPADPTKAADSSYTYTFAGWKVGETAFTASTPVNANTSVYADWTQTPVATSAQWEMVTDTGKKGLTVGDLVKPTVTGVTSERFYVIGIGTGTDPVITLLAEKNVKTNDTTANNVQSSSANTLAFRTNSTASNANVYSASDIKGEVDTYVGKLTTAGLTLEDVETAEGGSAVSGVKGRLMWGTATGSWDSNITTWTYSSGTGEIGALLDAGLTDLVYGPSTARLNYWLGSPNANFTCPAWCVIGGDSRVGNDDVSYSSRNGLRPVIKVLQSKFQKRTHVSFG